MDGYNLTSFVAHNLNPPMRTNAYNSTHDYVDKQSATFKTVRSVILVFFMVAGFVGNCSVCVLILRVRELRMKTNAFYVSLSVANIGIAVISIPFSLSSILGGKWTLGTELCRANGVVNPFWITALCLSITATTIHKYLTVTRPLKYELTQRKVCLMLAAVWLGSACISVWPLKERRQIVYKAVSSHCGYTVSGNRNEMYYLIMLACAIFLCPTFINTYCYVAMFHVLRKHRRRTKRSTVIDASGKRAQRRSIVTLYVVFFVFFITWLPFNVYSVMFISKRENLLPDWALAASYLCAYSTCVQIPVVIIYRSAKLRSHFKQLVRSLLCVKHFRLKISRRVLEKGSIYSNHPEEQRKNSAWCVSNHRPVRKTRETDENNTFVTWGYECEDNVVDDSKL